MIPLAAGFDVAYARHGDEEIAFGALTVYTAPHRTPCRVETVQMLAPAPHIPGRLALRELPVLHALWQRLDEHPLVLFIDGSGYMHPQRRGFATIAGEALGVRSVGVVKRPHLGDMDRPLEGPGDAVGIRDGNELLGYAWRPFPPAWRMLYISAGNAMTPIGALCLVSAWTREGKAKPEPLRMADRFARRLREEVLAPEPIDWRTSVPAAADGETDVQA